MSHGHPDEQPGGAEQWAYELFRYWVSSGHVRATFLFVMDVAEGPASPVSTYGDRPAEYWFPMTSTGQFATHYSIFNDDRAMTPRFRERLGQFMASSAPDIVYITHYYRIGLPVIELVRHLLPRAVLILTLWDYKVLCPANGYLLKTWQREPSGIQAICSGPELAECLRCCPERSTSDLLEREARARAVLDLVDLFVAPTQFLANLYLGWGLPVEKLVQLPQGRQHPSPPRDLEPDRRPLHYGFFGRAHPVKGLHVLLDAIDVLDRRPVASERVEFFINAAGLEMNPSLLDRVRRRPGGGCPVHLRGSYRHHELASRMREVDWVVVPSIWYENSTLVVEEAFMFKRPVICSDLGAMAETVRHDIDGLRFRVGDANDLARAIEQSAGNDVLWRRLRDGAPDVPRLANTAGALLRECARVAATR